MLERLRSFWGSQPRPPETREVARRAVVLRMVITYAMVRGQGVADSGGGARLRAVARSAGLWRSFSPKERGLLRDTSAALPPQSIINASWRLEALGTLLWALKLVPWLPPFDQQFTAEIATTIPTDGLGEFIDGLGLRSVEELERERDRAELWHWRSRTRQLIEEHRPFPEMPAVEGGPRFSCYDDIVRFTAKAAGESGTLAEVLDEDFVAKGKPYRDLTATEWAEVTSITVERHFALNWLCGRARGNRWDETPTDT
ncbi:MAG TPA: DUF4272 domain-containing protein [Verrucomicrobiota bacterium]|nr:DUF4272 domain-containing protein [Verrucomicrobiota bacterium]